MSPRERRVEAAFRIDKRRRDWRLGRWAAKSAVRALVRADAPRLSHLEILAGESGAPRVFFDGLPAPYSLSISHSRQRALVAVADGGSPLGCDLEWVERRSAAFERDYLTRAELELLAEQPESERARLATLVWCLKESALKALEEGLRADTRSVEVTSPGSRPRPGRWQSTGVRVAAGSRAFDAWWRLDGEQVLAIVGERPAEPNRQALAALCPPTQLRPFFGEGVEKLVGPVGELLAS